MFNIDINITNPFVEKDFKMLWWGFWSITKNKTLEYQLNRTKGTICRIDLSLFYRGHDHAGPFFEFGLFGWSFIISLPDNRHWDRQNKTWKI